MSHIYLVLGIIGWTITPIVLLAYAFWPSRTVNAPRDAQDLPADSKEKSFR